MAADPVPAVNAGRRVLVVGSLAESLVNFRGDLLRELKARGCDVLAAAPPGPAWVDEALARWQVRRIVLPLQRTGTNPLRDLALLRALRRLLRQERPQALLAYTAKPVIYGLLAAGSTGVPRKVALITGLGFSFNEPRSPVQAMLQAVARGLYRVAVRRADGVLFQNEEDRLEFASRRMLRDGQRVSVIAGSGVNLDRFPRQGLPPPPRQFLLIARLLVDKGIREYIAAARRIHARRPDLRFNLVGPLENHVAAVPPDEIESAVRDGSIVYHGAVRDVRPLLAACHVFVLPSFYREGVPRTLLEALATGRPIITTDLPGCRQTVVPGANGAFVPARDAAALEREMLRFADLPDVELQAMADESRRLAEAEFDVRKVNAAIVAALLADA